MLITPEVFGLVGIMVYKFQVNEYGISVHLGPNTVLIEYEQVRRGNDITHESRAGVTLVDPDSGNKLFLPRRLWETYSQAVEVMKSLHMKSGKAGKAPADGKFNTGP